MDSILFRVLVTASRNWENTPAVRQWMGNVILDVFRPMAGYVELDQTLIIHGAQGRYRNGVLVSGGDRILAFVASELGMLTKGYHAKWEDPCREACHHGARAVNRYGRDYCQWAGFYRNEEMVDLKPSPDVCVGFPLGKSTGTRNCMQCAHKAGIYLINACEVYEIPVGVG
jgi:hypothetical protein